MKRLAGILLLLALGFSPLFADSSTAPKNGDQVLYPKSAAESSTSQNAGGMGPMTAFLVVVLAGSGCWLLWRNRQMAKASGLGGKLVIAETKSLGSKQYLVVAAYGSQKFLLGVCPGKITLLTPLNEPGPSKES